MCEDEKLKALFLKLHQDGNDSYSNVHEFYKTQELRFSRSVSKDDGGKVNLKSRLCVNVFELVINQKFVPYNQINCMLHTNSLIF